MSESEIREAAAIGLRPEDYENDNEFLVWPDNWRYVRLFDALGTQWIPSAVGPVGLNYASFHWTFSRMGFKPREFDEAFSAMQIMEIAALKEMRG